MLQYFASVVCQFTTNGNGDGGDGAEWCLAGLHHGKQAL